MEKLFGTDGLRGRAGEFPLDHATVELLGRILYFHLMDRGWEPVLIAGGDTRESGPDILDSLSRGFNGAGGNIQEAGILSTPALAWLAQSQHKCAVSITASHNHFTDNGIKVFNPEGMKITEQQEQEIEPYLLGKKPFDRTSQVSPGERIRRYEYFHSTYCEYLENILFKDLDLRGMKIAIDCANGALYQVAPRVFRELGADVTAIHAEPNGKNINESCGSLHPESMLTFLKQEPFDCGFAFDGDGDRCLIGDRMSIYDGDFILAAAANFLNSRNTLNHHAVVATSMSNLGLEMFLKDRGIVLHRVPVGDKYVLEKLVQDKLSLGGEQSGHIIFMNESQIGDGLLTALEILRMHKKSGTRAVSQLWEGFVKFPQILLNIPVRKKTRLETLPEVSQKMNLIEKELQDSGRMVVRYSGTEMLARIMIEGRDQAQIEQMANELGESIRRLLN